VITVPAIVPIAFVFGTGWRWFECEFSNKRTRRAINSLIIFLLILFAFQGPVIAHHLHQEKADIPALAEYAQKVIPNNAKVYTPTEYTRTRLYLERELV